jgi:signal transduction histidine kinase
MENESVRILYVDDEEPNLINFKFLFQSKYKVHTALSALQAFEILKKDEFEIILSDQRMPEMTGISFLSEVSKLYPNTIRILLTAYTETQDIIDAINIGQVYQYITKPYQKKDMEKVLEKAHEIWSLRRQNVQLISKLRESNEEYEQINEELRQSFEELVKTKEKAENSERKTKELFNELMQAKEKAEESDRLKTSFLQNISHEIRTPMNAIVGFSGILENPDVTEERRRSFITIIQNSSQHLLSIVDDILTIASLETKQEKTNIQKTSINTIFSDLLEIFSIQASNQKISFKSNPGLSDKDSEIYTDGTKFNQVMSNLLTNALKFTSQGSIEFGYELTENQTNKYLLFYVKDTGIGIKKEMHDKIFDRFRQVSESKDKKYGGTGLGLAISKAFVEMLDGKIWVESELNKGSIFYFTIPYNPANNTWVEIPVKHYRDKKTILIAEDEEYNYLFIKEVLLAMNFNTIHARDGKETIDICKSNNEIGLILMDIKMPNIDGQQAAIEIKEFRPDLPIIAQSAYALEKEREKYSGKEFDDYITKPIKQSELKEKILKFL